MSRKIIDAEIEIKDIEFPNKGIGFFEGEKIAIKNTIPGQVVKADVKKKKGNFEGRLKEIVKKADYEIEPKCKAFGLCGGCTYQNIDYAKEVEFKKNNVLKLLQAEDLGEYEFLGVENCPCIEEYRNKMEFSFGDTGVDGELSLGMRKRMSYYEVVNADECLIVHPDIRKALKVVLDFFKASNETFYHKSKRTGTLRHLLVRRGFFTGEMLINLVTTGEFNMDLTPLAEKLKELDLNGEVVGFLHTINDSIADVVKADKLRVIFGRDYIYDKLLGLKFKISAFSFFQTNSQGAEVLYSVVRDFAGQEKNKVIFDLYCGTGTIAQIMSPKAEKVIGIEIVGESVEAAKINAKLNGIDNCEFIAGDVLKTVDSLADKPDLIVLDPPREGIHPKAIGKIIDFGADKLIYVSCKASSLTKDLKIFVENGYKIQKIKCVDMFGRTYHVETVVLLSKKEKNKEINKFSDIESIEQLKSLGSQDVLKNEINALIYPMNTNAHTYEDLLEVINCLKKNWVGFTDEYFVNNRKKYEYILTKIEGKNRNMLLGITDQMYENPEMAKKWYKNIVKYIHPDVGGIDEKAFIVLTKLYNIMREE